MRVLVLTLMISFLGQSAFGAAGGAFRKLDFDEKSSEDEQDPEESSEDEQDPEESSEDEQDPEEYFEKLEIPGYDAWYHVYNDWMSDVEKAGKDEAVKKWEKAFPNDCAFCFQKQSSCAGWCSCNDFRCTCWCSPGEGKDESNEDDDEESDCDDEESDCDDEESDGDKSVDGGGASAAKKRPAEDKDGDEEEGPQKKQKPAAKE